MAYRKIESRIWDDEKIADLPPITKLVWVYLLTGKHTTSLPGIWNVGPASIAEGLRIALVDVESAMADLERVGLIERDARLRLIRAPRAPRYNEAANAAVVKSWWAQWRDLPESMLKYRHVACLKAGVRAKAAVEAWDLTFATVPADACPPPSSSRRVSSAPLSVPAAPSSPSTSIPSQPVAAAEQPSEPFRSFLKGSPAPAPDLVPALEGVQGEATAGAPPTPRSPVPTPPPMPDPSQAPEAAELLTALTGQSVIVTCAERGQRGRDRSLRDLADVLLPLLTGHGGKIPLDHALLAIREVAAALAFEPDLQWPAAARRVLGYVRNAKGPRQDAPMAPRGQQPGPQRKVATGSEPTLSKAEVHKMFRTYQDADDPEAA
jgi:hypothetical protein